MKLLDLFCGAGGGASGYYRAGFHDITGVDIKPQPRYPYDFIQGDALEYLEKHGREFDLVHASPPCQAFSLARNIHGHDHPDLLAPTRDMLDAVGRPYVIENVPNSPMRCDVRLCGSLFGLRVRRHRIFETHPRIFSLLPDCDHTSPPVRVFGHGGDIYNPLPVWKEAMGIDWMKKAELAQAIPPAYTEWIGREFGKLIGASHA